MPVPLRWEPLVYISREEQIAHIEEHQSLFDEHQGVTSANAKTYFNEGDEYQYGDRYWNLCIDLGIEPRGGRKPSPERE